MSSRRQKHKRTYNEPGQAHYLTCSCDHRWPLLNNDRARRWLIEAISNACKAHDFSLWAYVIMPEHVHLLVFPRQQQCRVSKLLFALKRPVSYRAKQHLIETGRSDWLERLTVQKGKRSVFRFWLQGGGYDENLWNDKPIEAVIDYIHNNPIRRKLVKRATDWKWSSAAYYAGEQNVPMMMDPIEW